MIDEYDWFIISSPLFVVSVCELLCTTDIVPDQAKVRRSLTVIFVSFDMVN